LNVAVLIEIEVESGQILFHHYADGDKMSQDMFTVLLKARDRLPCPTGSIIRTSDGQFASFRGQFLGCWEFCCQV
jgi:hypothetical protein